MTYSNTWIIHATLSACSESFPGYLWGNMPMALLLLMSDQHLCSTSIARLYSKDHRKKTRVNLWLTEQTNHHLALSFFFFFFLLLWKWEQMPNETTKQSSTEIRNSCNRDTQSEYLEQCTYFSMPFHVIPGQSGSRLALHWFLSRF